MIKINADQLPRFMACNPSIKMAATVPPSFEDNTARDEGIAAHYMAAVAFNKGRDALAALIDTKAPNGHFMTRDMAEHVNDYLELAIAQTTTCQVERDTSHAGRDWSVGGRVDVIASGPDLLRVTDLKYGYRIVEPKMNWTLLSHAMGYVAQLNDQSQLSWGARIELAVYQPRAHHPDGPFRVWEINRMELAEYTKILSDALSVPSDELRTSQFCGKCRANATCPAARLAEMNAIDAATTMYHDNISDDYLSLTLDNLKRASEMIISRLDAFQELAKHRLQSGAIINNYTTEPGLGNRAWKPGLSPELLEAMTGVKLTTAKPVTPAEAERRGVDKKTIETLTHRPSTGTKLIRATADEIVKRSMKRTKGN